MFIRAKTIKDHDYYYLCQNVWEDGKCHQRVVRYLGRVKPSPQILAEVLKPSA